MPIIIAAFKPLTRHPMLNGKTALVTGSTSGIGLGLAHALAKTGVPILWNSPLYI